MSRKKLLIVGAGCGCALLAFGALFATIVGGGGLDAVDKLRIAMSLLDEGRWDLAGRIARDLESEGRIDPESDSAWNYVQGVSKLKSVEENLDAPKNRKVLLDAAEHLAKAEELGFPSGYLGKGKYYIGWCSFNTYRWDQAAEQLKEADRLWPEKRSEAFQMMVEAQLRRSPPDFAVAENVLAAWKAIPGMSDSELAKICLVEANLAFLKQAPERCEELLSHIQQDTPEFVQGMFWKARWRLEQAGKSSSGTESERQKLLIEAAEILRSLRLAAETPNVLRRQASYLLGRVLRAQGLTQEALSTFNAARQNSPQSAEAIVAGMEEAEILVDTHTLGDAISSLHHVLDNIEDLSLYNEAWMTIPEFRARLLEIGRKFRNAGEFDRAIELAGLIALAFPKADSVRLKAEALEEWADVIATNPPANGSLAQEEQREQIRAKHLEAAQQYETLARLELRSSEYPDILWRSISNYQSAAELDKANTLLVDYLSSEDRTKRPRGFLALGRNLVNAAQWQKAIEPLSKCQIEHPTHPISFEARLLSAKAMVELDRLDEAITLLNENLSGDAAALRPTSDIWRDSLFQLAQTTYRQGDELLLEIRLDPTMPFNDREAKLKTSSGKFLEVVNHLGGFVTRYPEDPRHFDAIYLIAKSLRLAAETPYQLALSDKALVDATRRKLMQERRRLLELALAEFRKLHQVINDRQDLLVLPEHTNTLIRNALFGEADTLFDLGRWEEAVDAYQNVASRFLNQPESLEALLQMAQCYRKVGQPASAKRILAQAEQVLARIPPEYDTQFVSLTRTSRAGWSELISSLRSWD